MHVKGTKTFVRKTWREDVDFKRSHRQEDQIKDAGHEGKDCIHVNQNRDQRSSLGTQRWEFRVHKMRGVSEPANPTTAVSRITPHHWTSKLLSEQKLKTGIKPSYSFPRNQVFNNNPQGSRLRGRQKKNGGIVYKQVLINANIKIKTWKER